MYQQYYTLSENPFQTSPDPRFLWVGRQQRQILDALKHGSRGEEGFMVFTGDTGSGKTTLINAFVMGLPQDTSVAVLSDPSLGKIEFFNLLAESFGFQQKFADKIQFITFFVRRRRRRFRAILRLGASYAGARRAAAPGPGSGERGLLTGRLRCRTWVRRR